MIHDIWKATAGRAIIVTDVGQHQMWAAQYYKVAEPGTFITSGGLGTMGFGVPAAIGAKMARPDREVWAIVGDGGFQMTQAELQTIVQENVKVNVAIINNGYLGMVRQWQQFFHDRRYSATPMSSPDYVKLADAHGLPGIRVTRRADMADALRHARASAGAVVMDFRVEQEDTVYPMVSPGAALHDMIKRPGAVSLVGDGSRPVIDRSRPSRPRTIVVRYEHEIDALDRVAGDPAPSARARRSVHGRGVARSRDRAGDDHVRQLGQDRGPHRVAARAADRRAGGRRLDFGGDRSRD